MMLERRITLLVRLIMLPPTSRVNAIERHASNRATEFRRASGSALRCTAHAFVNCGSPPMNHCYANLTRKHQSRREFEMW